jgi:hypothetical protein
MTISNGRPLFGAAATNAMAVFAKFEDIKIVSTGGMRHCLSEHAAET